MMVRFAIVKLGEKTRVSKIPRLLHRERLNGRAWHLYRWDRWRFYRRSTSIKSY